MNGIAHCIHILNSRVYVCVCAQLSVCSGCYCCKWLRELFANVFMDVREVLELWDHILYDIYLQCYTHYQLQHIRTGMNAVAALSECGRSETGTVCIVVLLLLVCLCICCWYVSNMYVNSLLFVSEE